MVSPQILSTRTVSDASTQYAEEELPLLNLPTSRFARKSYISQWIPEVEPLHPRARTFRTWHSRRDVVLWTATAVSFTVLLVNVITTAVFTIKNPPTNDIGTIFKGSHTQVTRISTGIHVLINVLSTLLLGASNMCMQLCVAPTRSELDRAHAKCQWLDIGAPSIKNMRWIHPWRIPLVLLLALTSIPLHFLYNSAVFSSLAINTYQWVLVNPNFLTTDRTSWNFTATLELQNTVIPRPPTGSAYDWEYPWVHSIWHDFANESRQFHKISSLECLQRYTSTFGNRSDLIVVSTDNAAMQSSNSLLWMGNWGAAYLDHPGDWACFWGFNQYQEVLRNSSKLTSLSFANCDIFGSLEYFTGSTLQEKEASRVRIVDNWHIWNYYVSYCLASVNPTHDLYTVGYSRSIMIAICVANLCKCLGILTTAIWYRKHHDAPISILGDAIASYLEKPDSTTRQLGACSIDDIKRREKMRVFDGFKDETRRWRIPSTPLEWKAKRSRWFHGASKGRWALALILCWLVILTGLGLLISGVVAIASGLSGLTSIQRLGYVFSLGFGKPNASALVKWLTNSATFSNGTAELYKNVMFANVWQFAISFLYLLVNALVTSMLVGSEWAHYGRHRKPLRVSAPEGIQRSSFFISMPYKYGGPLMASVSILHWAMSQAVFVVQISSYFSTGAPDKIGSTSAVGYSPSAITVSIGLGISIVLGVVLLGSKNYDPSMPLASTCSAAISAACHPPEEDYDARYFPVMWGVVESNSKGFVHCSFTTASDARPLGESTGWREWQIAEEKRETIKSDLQSRRGEGKNEKANIKNKPVRATAEEKIGFKEGIKCIFTSRFWKEAGTNGKNWLTDIFNKLFHRHSKVLPTPEDTHDEKIDNEEEEFIDIVAPWPKSTSED